jgi:hypothetical protein
MSVCLLSVCLKHFSSSPLPSPSPTSSLLWTLIVLVLFLSHSSYDLEAKYFRAANSKYTLLLFLFIFTLFIHTLVKEWTMQRTFNHFLLFFIFASSHLCESWRIIYFIHLHFEDRISQTWKKVSNVCSNINV